MPDRICSGFLRVFRTVQKVDASSSQADGFEDFLNIGGRHGPLGVEEETLSWFSEFFLRSIGQIQYAHFL